MNRVHLEICTVPAASRFSSQLFAMRFIQCVSTNKPKKVDRMGCIIVEHIEDRLRYSAFGL